MPVFKRVRQTFLKNDEILNIPFATIRATGINIQWIYRRGSYAIENIYHNYDKHPYREIRGFDNEAWEGSKAIVKEIERHIQDLLKKQDKVIVNFDFYPGVRKEEIFEMFICCIQRR